MGTWASKDFNYENMPLSFISDDKPTYRPVINPRVKIKLSLLWLQFDVKLWVYANVDV
jgi:hypothetical protein